MSLPETETSTLSTLRVSSTVRVLEDIAGTIEKIFHPINKKLSFIICTVLAFMVLYVVSDVLVRIVSHRSLTGAIEIQEFALVIIAFLGFTREEGNRDHIRIDLFVNHLPKWVRNMLDNLFYLVVSVLFTIMSWQTAIQITKKLTVVSFALKIPISIFIGIAAVGLILLTITLYKNFILTTIEVIKNKKTPFLLLSFLAGLSLFLLPYYVRSISFTMEGLALGSVVLLFLFALMFLGMPIGYAMALMGYIGMLLVTKNGVAVGSLMGISPYHSTATFFLAVLPAFLIMGSLAFYSGISGNLFNAANAWLSRLRGGLAMSSVAGCALFGAICGDSMSTAVTMSKVALPEMRKLKYDPGLATGSLAAGGTLGILIPPSIGFIIYAFITEESVGKLFVSGIVPGIILALLFIGMIYLKTKRNPDLCPRGERFPLKERLRSLKGILPVIILFGLVLGGMLIGFFSANEGGAVGAFGAFIIAFIGKKLTWKNLIKSLEETTAITARVFCLVIGVGIFGSFLAATQIPVLLADFVSGLGLNKYVILAMVIILYIILGCLMNVIPMIMLSLPTIFPTIIALGFDPIWFGVLIVILMEMGQITPPVGINVFAISSTAGDIPMQTVFKGIVPFFICMSIMIIILITFPQLATFLPKLLY